MKQLKKAVSLVAMLAFLITALVPASGLAATVPDPTNVVERSSLWDGTTSISIGAANSGKSWTEACDVIQTIGYWEVTDVTYTIADGVFYKVTDSVAAETVPEDLEAASGVTDTEFTSTDPYLIIGNAAEPTDNVAIFHIVKTIPVVSIGKNVTDTENNTAVEEIANNEANTQVFSDFTLAAVVTAAVADAGGTNATDKIVTWPNDPDTDFTYEWSGSGPAAQSSVNKTKATYPAYTAAASTGADYTYNVTVKGTDTTSALGAALGGTTGKQAATDVTVAVDLYTATGTVSGASADADNGPTAPKYTASVNDEAVTVTLTPMLNTGEADPEPLSAGRAYSPVTAANLPANTKYHWTTATEQNETKWSTSNAAINTALTQALDTTKAAAPIYMSIPVAAATAATTYTIVCWPYDSEAAFNSSWISGSSWAAGAPALAAPITFTIKVEKVTDATVTVEDVAASPAVVAYGQKADLSATVKGDNAALAGDITWYAYPTSEPADPTNADAVVVEAAPLPSPSAAAAAVPVEAAAYPTAGPRWYNASVQQPGPSSGPKPEPAVGTVPVADTAKVEVVKLYPADSSGEIAESKQTVNAIQGVDTDLIAIWGTVEDEGDPTAKAPTTAPSPITWTAISAPTSTTAEAAATSPAGQAQGVVNVPSAATAQSAFDVTASYTKDTNAPAELTVPGAEFSVQPLILAANSGAEGVTGSVTAGSTTVSSLSGTAYSQVTLPLTWWSGSASAAPATIPNGLEVQWTGSFTPEEGAASNIDVAGGTVDATTGAITAGTFTPEEAGTYTITAKAMNGQTQVGGAAAGVVYTITVEAAAEGTIIIQPSNTQSVQAGSGDSVTFTAMVADAEGKPTTAATGTWALTTQNASLQSNLGWSASGNALTLTPNSNVTTEEIGLTFTAEDGTEVTATLKVTPVSAITITKTPEDGNLSYTLGSTQVSPMSITATGGLGTLSYQWYAGANADGTPIDDATANSYTPNASAFAGKEVGDAVQFTVKVTDSAEPVTSNTATFTYTVGEAAPLTVQAQTSDGAPSETVEFTKDVNFVAAGGAGSYSWALASSAEEVDPASIAETEWEPATNLDGDTAITFTAGDPSLIGQYVYVRASGALSGMGYAKVQVIKTTSEVDADGTTVVSPEVDAGDPTEATGSIDIVPGAPIEIEAKRPELPNGDPVPNVQAYWWVGRNADGSDATWLNPADYIAPTHIPGYPLRAQISQTGSQLLQLWWDNALSIGRAVNDQIYVDNAWGAPSLSEPSETALYTMKSRTEMTETIGVPAVGISVNSATAAPSANAYVTARANTAGSELSDITLVPGLYASLTSTAGPVPNANARFFFYEGDSASPISTTPSATYTLTKTDLSQSGTTRFTARPALNGAPDTNPANWMSVEIETVTMHTDAAGETSYQRDSLAVGTEITDVPIGWDTPATLGASSINPANYTYVAAPGPDNPNAAPLTISYAEGAWSTSFTPTAEGIYTFTVTTTGGYGGTLTYQFGTQNAAPVGAGVISFAGQRADGKLPAAEPTRNQPTWTPVSGSVDPTGQNNVAALPVMQYAANKRFAIYVPNTFWSGTVTNANSYFEWEYRTSANEAGGNPIAIPSGMGFYGVNSNWLRSGPITYAMDGWEFRLVKRIRGQETANAQYTPWITLDVTDADRIAQVPNVTITSVPQSSAGNVTVAQGGTLTFTANTQNGLDANALTYQWVNRPAPTADAPNPAWAPIPGETNSTYTISDVDAANNGVSYACQVTNTAFTNIMGTSNSITLRVNTADGAVIITSPGTSSIQSLYASRTATFTVDAKTDNGDELTYQWYRKGMPGPITYGGVIKSVSDAQRYLANRPTEVAIPGATSATYTTPALEEGVFEYVCRVTNASNAAQSANSAGFYLVITQQSRIPKITKPVAPTNQAYAQVGTPAGTAITMPCDATVQSGEALTYQWYASQSATSLGNPLNGETGASLTLAAPSGENNGWYYTCVVTNAAANTSTPSAPYQLTVWNTTTVPQATAIDPRNINAQWNNQAATIKSSASIPSIATLATGNLTASWLVNGTPLIESTAYTSGNITIAPSIDGAVATSTVTISGNIPASELAAILGEWECIWTNNVAQVGNGLAPQTSSGTDSVHFQIESYPDIVVQPTNTSVAVGDTATFAVGADLYEGQSVSPRGTLVYVWQYSEDGGLTWNNCTSTQGTGQFTSTFSVPVTQAMYDYATAANVQGFNNPCTYRVNVGNRTSGYNVYSNVAQLTITLGTEVTPVIGVKDGADLTITESAELGKIVSGTALTVTKDGHKTSEVQDMLTFTPDNAAYQLRIVDAEGTALSADDVVGTGCKIELVGTADGDKVLDTVTIIVRGDVNGSGVISLTQLVRMAAAFKDAAQLDALYTLAGDLDGNGAINLTDLVQEAAIYRGEILDAAATSAPSAAPTTEPTTEPTEEPTTEPTTAPTAEPTTAPTESPSASA